MSKPVRFFFGNLTLLALFNVSIPVAALAAAPAQGNGPKSGTYTLTDDMIEARASEYVMRRFPGEHLIPVRILSGVRNPGTYYLPEGTDLITAVALSGGLTSTADPEKLHWNQWATQKSATLDLGDAVADPQKQNPKLGANDILMIDESKPWISNNTVLLVSIVTGVLSIVLGAKALTK
ncbi:MAG: SLBB domain-containing protein [Bdellovibrionota bacterium]